MVYCFVTKKKFQGFVVCKMFDPKEKKKKNWNKQKKMKGAGIECSILFSFN